LLNNVLQAVGGSWFKCWVWAYLVAENRMLRQQSNGRVQSDTPGKAGGLMSGTASKAVDFC